MSRTIKAIECHMIPQAKVPPVRRGLQSRAAKLVAEWQQAGPETLSGHALRKLRLALAPTQSKTNKRANWWKFLQPRRRRHDPMLVLNMSRFNFRVGWNRVFNPVPPRENVWC